MESRCVVRADRACGLFRLHEILGLAERIGAELFHGAKRDSQAVTLVEIDDQRHAMRCVVPFRLWRDSAGFAESLAVEIQLMRLNLVPALHQIVGEALTDGGAVIAR